jgi:hypothetical protein
VVAEANNGGQLVETVLRTVNPSLPITLVHASRGKLTRAEPIAALYEQGKIHHIGGLPELEDQLCTWVPAQGASRTGSTRSFGPSPSCSRERCRSACRAGRRNGAATGRGGAQGEEAGRYEERRSRHSGGVRCQRRVNERRTGQHKVPSAAHGNPRIPSNRRTSRHRPPRAATAVREAELLSAPPAVASDAIRP